MKLQHIVSRSMAFLIMAAMMFVLAGCSGDMKTNEDYVTNVKTLVNDAIQNTRTLKEQDESFNCHNQESTKAYLSTLNSLSSLYQQILKLDTPAKFEESGESLQTNASSALSTLSEMKSLVTYALQNEDDTLFQKDKAALWEEYEKAYSGATDNSSEIQTIWRNA